MKKYKNKKKKRNLKKFLIWTQKFKKNKKLKTKNIRAEI